MIGEDVLFSSVRELGEGLRARRFTSLDLTEGCLARLEALGPSLGAVVTITRELALEQARKADAEAAAGRWRSPLHGIPYGAKDLLATRGIPTTWGAEPLRGQVFDHDATVVARLRDAGAVLVAKLAMVELAGGLGYNNPDASFTGPGRSPWNPAHWSGGSSSGSGAATAAALVGFAIGSETSGSILTPCAFSGVSGLRPTYGRVSRHGAMALCWTLDKLGPMARTAEDCALVFQAVAGPDPADASTVDAPFTWSGGGPDKRRYRIGVLRDATARSQPEVAKNFEASIEVLRTFAEVVTDVPFPDLPWGDAVGVIVDAEGAAAFRALIESGRTRELRARKDRYGGHAAYMTLAVDYLEAMRARVPMRAKFDALMQQFDAVVTPTRTAVAPPIGYDFDRPPGDPSPSPSAAPGGGQAPRPPATIPAGNLVGAPAVCVPNGFGRDGLPTSLQFLGRAFSEEVLLALAHRYQQATDWHRRRPPLDRLTPAPRASAAAWQEHGEPGRADVYRL